MSSKADGTFRVYFPLRERAIRENRNAGDGSIVSAENSGKREDYLTGESLDLLLSDSSKASFPRELSLSHISHRIFSRFLLFIPSAIYLLGLSISLSRADHSQDLAYTRGLKTKWKKFITSASHSAGRDTTRPRFARRTARGREGSYERARAKARADNDGPNCKLWRGARVVKERKEKKKIEDKERNERNDRERHAELANEAGYTEWRGGDNRGVACRPASVPHR